MPAHLIVEEGPLAGQILEFKDKDRWIIGRDPELADIILEDSTVSREHLLCLKTDDGIVVKNLSTINPTVINEMIIDEPLLLSEGDRIQIGHNTLIYSEEEIISKDKEEDSDKEQTFLDEIEEDELNPYDTIFEDADDDQALPLNLLGEAPLLLKVLSGPNAGAEIGLEKSHSYIIGKDPNSCDIVFQDLSVSRNHARVTVEADGRCYFEDLDSKNGVLVNNKRIEDRTEVTTQDTISLGTTTMLLIDKESALETIYSPVEEILPEKEEDIAAKARVEEDWKKRIIPKKYLYLASCFAVFVFMMFISFFSLFKGNEVEIAWKDHSSEVNKFISNYPGVVYTYNPTTEKIFLSGHLLTSTRLQELMYNLEQEPFIKEIDNAIVVDEYVWKNINNLLSSNADWKAARITSTKPGLFILSGYVETIDQSEGLLNFVHLNFPYNDRLSNKLVVEQLLNAEVQSMMQQMGFTGLNFQLTNGELILAGSYPENKNKELSDMIATLAKTPGISSVRNLGVSTTADTARIDISSKYQITGNADLGRDTYSVLINGKIYMEGEMLDGMEITSLKNDLVLLERGALRYKIEYSL